MTSTSSRRSRAVGSPEPGPLDRAGRYDRAGTEHASDHHHGSLAAAAAAATWGPVQDGVRVRARPVRRIWQAGETVAFKTDVRHVGTFDLQLPESGRTCELQVDGQSYGWDVDLTGGSPAHPEVDGQSTRVTGVTRLLPFGPGQPRRNLDVTLNKGWQAATEAELGRFYGDALIDVSGAT